MNAVLAVHIPFSPSLAQKQQVWHWVLQSPIIHTEIYSCISFTFLYLTHTVVSGKKLMWEFTWGTAEAFPRLLQKDIIHKTYINLSKNKCFPCSEKDKRFLTEDSKGGIVPSEELLENCFQFSASIGLPLYSVTVKEVPFSTGSRTRFLLQFSTLLQ